MQPIDPRTAELTERITAAVMELFRSIHRHDGPEQVAGHATLLLNEMLKSRNALAERPSDEPLRRAIGRLP